MRRSVGIIIFVVGVVLIVGAVLKILPGGTIIWFNTGLLASISGLVAFGLSFIRQPPVEEDAPPPLSPAERLAGVFYEPARVFRNLRYYPRWLAAFQLIALSAVLYQFAFTQRVTPEAIAGAMNTQFDKVVESGWMTPERAEIAKEQTLAQAKTPAARITAPLNTIGGTFLILLFVSALVLLAALMFGGRINYWQALSITAYSSMPPFVIQSLLSIVLLFLKPLDQIDPIKDQQGLVRADLSLLFTPSEHPLLYVAASFIGILSLYRLWLTATGLRETPTRLSNGSAWAIALLLGILYLLFVLLLASLFPNFVS